MNYENDLVTKPECIPEEEWPVGKWVIMPGMKGDLVAEQFESYTAYQVFKDNFNLSLEFFPTELEAWQNEYKRRALSSDTLAEVHKNRLEIVEENIKRLGRTIVYPKPRPLSLCAHKSSWEQWNLFNTQMKKLRNGLLKNPASGSNVLFGSDGSKELRLSKPEAYICLGEIPNMIGHGVFLNENKGSTHTSCHMSDFRELTDDEV